ncbi:MAG: hypothetical protein GY938_00650, partial [Ketobacter sp.]|nr:hypothetical protein [Ketobacter sp.]
MTTFDQTANASADDAHETENNTNFSSTADPQTVRANSSANFRWNSGVSFPSVTIPQGATIDVAYLTIVPNSTSVDDADCTIYCEDVDDADDYSTTADVTDRTLTTANVSWVAGSLGASAVNTPSLVTIVQEVVDRGSWASGNRMNFLLKGASSGSDRLQFKSADNGTAGDRPKLHVEYTAGGGTEYTHSAAGAVSFAGTPVKKT